MAETPPHHPSERALRDALGLVRLLYAVTLEETRRAALARAGEHLMHALEMSRKPPGTLGFKAVPFNAESAFDVLRAMTWAPDIAPLVDAAEARVKAAQARAYDVEASAERAKPH